jgi:septal ring factor EnvC (AmiA/AmiB activator)
MTRPIFLRRAALLAGTAAMALLGACASTPPPTDQMAVSTAALAHAASAGSAELAPIETSMARDKLARARNAIANNDNDLALDLAQQAQVDAQLAESKAESIKARKSAEAVQEANRALREELARKTP